MGTMYNFTSFKDLHAAGAGRRGPAMIDVIGVIIEVQELG